MEQHRRRLTQDDYEQAADIISIVDGALRERFEVFNRLWIEYLAVCDELDGLRTPKPALQRIMGEAVKCGGLKLAPGVRVWYCPDCGIFVTPAHTHCWGCGQALSYELPTQGKDDDHGTNETGKGAADAE